MENKKLANLKFSVIVSMFYYLTPIFMTNTDMHDLVTLADPHGEGLTQSLE